MKYKQWLLAGVSLLMMSSVIFTGCSSKTDTANQVVDMEKETSNAVSMSFIGGKDVMPITAYFGPSVNRYFEDGDVLSEHLSDEYFEMFSELGINLITYSPIDYASTPSLIEQYLELGEKHEIGIFVTDSTITNKADGSEVTKEEVAKELLHYYEHPAFCGLYLIDEPDAPYFYRRSKPILISNYGSLAKVLQQDLNILCYSNLLPCSRYPDERDIYKQYVEEFCDTFQPKVLMWDYYVFGEYGSREGYFWNMDLIRTYAKKYQIPFWSYIQAGGQWSTTDDYAGGKNFPNEWEFNWNVNTSLAFGAQGIQYFPLIQPGSFAFALSEEGEFERNGLIGATGNKNQWFYYAKNINEHIAAIDEVLMNSVHKGIIVSGEQAGKDVQQTSCVIESGSFQELTSITGDAMVGCFNYNGKTALYVVNYSTEYAQNITLKFNDTHNIKQVQNTKSSYVNAESLTLDMSAGEGVLLVIE